VKYLPQVVSAVLCGVAVLCGPSAEAATSRAAEAAAPKLQLEAFASLPLVQRAALSPDGQMVALMVNNEGATTIAVQQIGALGGKRVSILSTDNRVHSFNWFRWISNERLLVSTRFPAYRSNGGIHNVPTLESRLLSASADGTHVINLLNPASFSRSMPPQRQDHVLDFEPDDGRHVWIVLPDEHASGPAVYSVDVLTGERIRVHHAREGFATWMVDRQHRVRLGTRVEKGGFEIHVCDPDGKNWRQLWSYKSLGKEAILPVGFGKDPNDLYVLADWGQGRALYAVDLRDVDLKPTLKVTTERTLVSGRLVYSGKTGEAIGLIGSTGTAEAEAIYWDADRTELTGLIDQALPGRRNRVVSLSADEARYLVYSSNDRIPGEFYLGDDRLGKMELLALAYPKLSARDMVAKQAVTLTARDGLDLAAALSLPRAVPDKGLPTVLLVSDHSYTAINLDFEPMTQFLVNRGYAVLQVAARGFSTHGSSPLNPTFGRWGMELQDDVTAAARWAIARGTADPRRICIVGAGYGGYAALMGVATTPDLFQCAVSFGGISDLVQLGSDESEYADGKEEFELLVGSLDKDRERLKATSPRLIADRIRAPVLLIHGTHDRTVPIRQSELMDAALTAANKPHRFVQQARGDHRRSIFEHNVQYFRELEAFLAQHLGSGTGTLAAPGVAVDKPD